MVPGTFVAPKALSSAAQNFSGHTYGTARVREGGLFQLPEVGPRML